MKKNYLLVVVILCLSVFQNVMAQCKLSITSSSSTSGTCNNTSVSLTAQPVLMPTDSLTSTFAGGNSHNGNMFSIVATNTVTIDSFTVSPQSSGNQTIQVFYIASAYASYEANSSAWTFLGSVDINPAVSGAFKLPLLIGVVIPAGKTYSFYVTTTGGLGGASLNYTDGTAEGNTYASDANISLLEGIGIAYPFGSTFSPRIWNGTIHYTVGAASFLWNTTDTTQTINPTVTASASTYSVQVAAPGCPTLYDTVKFGVNGVDVSTNIAGNTITAQATGASYQWYNCSTLSAIAGATNQSYTVTNASQYYAVIVTQGSCTDTSVCENVAVTGMYASSLNNGVSIYPNPTNGKVVISTGTDVADAISIMDATGKVLNTIAPSGIDTEADLSSYKEGIYFVKINNGTTTRVNKVVKQ